MKNFVITLVLGAAIGFGCAKALDQPAVAESSIVLPDLLKPGARFGIAHFNVEEGTDLEGFEDYLQTEYMPKWNAVWDKTGSGVRGHMVKGIGGDQAGKYGFILIFPDNETQQKYFSEDGMSDELMKLRDEIGIETYPVFEGYLGEEHLGDQLILPID